MPTNPVMDTTLTGRRNRSWPEALKREIVAASFAPGSSVSIVARRYDVNANQVFAWRKRFHDEPGAGSATSQLIPVRVTADQDSIATKASAGPETIEIELGCKYRIRVIGDVNAEALRRVLDVLERR